MAKHLEGTGIASPVTRRAGLLRVSIRLRVSLTLLVSALNGLLLFGVVVAVWASANKSGPDARDVLALIEQTSALGQRLVADEVTGVEEAFDALVSNVASAGADQPALLNAVEAWRITCNAALIAGRPDEQMDAAHLAQRQVLGQLQLLLADTAGAVLTRTPWLLEGLFAWVVLYALLMVVSAFEVNRTISGPIARLAASARRVAGGDLDEPIEPSGDSPELLDISAALEDMRRHLVRSIERLDLRQRRNAAMLDALSDGVVLLDDQARVLAWNPSAMRLLGRLPQRPLLRHSAALRQLLPESPWPLSPGTSEFPIDLATAEGALHYTVLIRELPDGQFVVVIADVTQFMEVENLKRDFLSVVTHELKTPLTAVKGFLKLLLMGKGGTLTERQVDLLTRAQIGADQLLRMVQDLLDTSRIESGQLSLQLGPLDPSEAARDVVATFAAEAENQGLALVVVGPETLPPVEVDAFRLAQVLGNLVRNALKFTEAGGEVRVRAGVVGSEALIAVEDTGRGIPASALPRLFEKFYQVERGDRRRQGGAGLGLTICKQLVEAMGGRISVTSTVDVGTSVLLHFPLARSPA